MVGKPAWRRLSGLVHVSPGEERPPTWADRANYVWGRSGKQWRTNRVPGYPRVTHPEKLRLLPGSAMGVFSTLHASDRRMQ